LSKTSKPARLDVGDDAFFATKGEPPPPATERAPARAPLAVEAPAPAESQADAQPRAQPAVRRKRKEKQPGEAPDPIATTIAFPPEIMRRIQDRLHQDQQHNLRTLVFYALSKIGIEIEPEHLVPTRRRWTR
jgi:hypothetical protein